MIDYPADIVVKVLYQEFPDLAQMVLNKIKEKIPVHTFVNFSEINDIIKHFCLLENIGIHDLVNTCRNRSIANKRRLLLAVILKIYNPEILYNMLEGLINPNISITVRSIIMISKKTYAADMQTAKGYYHIYQDFKNKVDLLYTKIIESHGAKKNESPSETI